MIFLLLNEHNTGLHLYAGHIDLGHRLELVLPPRKIKLVEGESID